MTTTCSQCPWSLADVMVPGGLEEAREMLAVLHVLVRHPDVYYEVTGIRPEAAVVEYAEPLADDLVMVLI